MYGEVIGVTTGVNGVVAIAALPATGGLRPLVLVYGILSLALGAVIVAASTASILRDRRAKNRA